VLAPSPPIDSRVSRAPAQGFVTGGARMLLRLEGFAAFAAAVAFYAQAGAAATGRGASSSRSSRSNGPTGRRSTPGRSSTPRA
jgi:hypothetical protein